MILSKLKADAEAIRESQRALNDHSKIVADAQKVAASVSSSFSDLKQAATTLAQSALEDLGTFIDGLWSASPPWHLCRYYVEAEAWRIAAESAVEYVERESALSVAQLRPAVESAAAFTEESISALLAPSTRFQASARRSLDAKLAADSQARNAVQSP